MILLYHTGKVRCKNKTCQLLFSSYNRVMTKAKNKKISLPNGSTVEEIGGAIVSTNPAGHTAIFSENSDEGKLLKALARAGAPVKSGWSTSSRTWCPSYYGGSNYTIESDYDRLERLKVRMLDLCTRMMPGVYHTPSGCLTVSEISIMLDTQDGPSVHAMLNDGDTDLKNGVLSINVTVLNESVRLLSYIDLVNEADKVIDECEEILAKEDKNV